MKHMNLVAKMLGMLGIALLVMGCQSHAPVREERAGGPRIEMGLNEGWKFVREDAPGAERVGFDDSTWQKVTLPHTWNNLDGEDG